MSALRLIAFLLFWPPSPCPEVAWYRVTVTFMCQSGIHCGVSSTDVPADADPLCLDTGTEPSLDTVYFWNEAIALDVDKNPLPPACQTGVPTLEP